MDGIFDSISIYIYIFDVLLQIVILASKKKLFDAHASERFVVIISQYLVFSVTFDPSVRL